MKYENMDGLNSKDLLYIYFSILFWNYFIGIHFRYYLFEEVRFIYIDQKEQQIIY